MKQIFKKVIIASLLGFQLVTPVLGFSFENIEKETSMFDRVILPAVNVGISAAVVYTIATYIVREDYKV